MLQNQLQNIRILSNIFKLMLSLQQIAIQNLSKQQYKSEEKSDDKKKSKGRVNARVASVISLACKELKIVKTHQEIYTACNVTESIFSQNLKKIKKALKEVLSGPIVGQSQVEGPQEMNARLGFIDQKQEPAGIAFRDMNRMDIQCEPTIRMAMKICKNISEFELMTGRNPISIACLGVYIALQVSAKYKQKGFVPLSGKELAEQMKINSNLDNQNVI